MKKLLIGLLIVSLAWNVFPVVHAATINDLSIDELIAYSQEMSDFYKRIATRLRKQKVAMEEYTDLTQQQVSAAISRVKAWAAANQPQVDDYVGKFD